MDARAAGAVPPPSGAKESFTFSAGAMASLQGAPPSPLLVAHTAVTSAREPAAAPLASALALFAATAAATEQPQQVLPQSTPLPASHPGAEDDADAADDDDDDDDDPAHDSAGVAPARGAGERSAATAAAPRQYKGVWQQGDLFRAGNPARSRDRRDEVLGHF